jgi:hypothetical protein
MIDKGEELDRERKVYVMEGKSFNSGVENGNKVK